MRTGMTGRGERFAGGYSSDTWEYILTGDEFFT